VLQCVTVCCSVSYLRESNLILDIACVVSRCSMVQCVAVGCSVLQCAAMCCSALQCVAVRYSVLQCVIIERVEFDIGYRMRCIMLQYGTMCCSVLQCVLQCVIFERVVFDIGHRMRCIRWSRSKRYPFFSSHFRCSVLQRVAVCCSGEELLMGSGTQCNTL